MRFEVWVPLVKEEASFREKRMEERLAKVEEALQEVLRLLREGKKRSKYQAKYYVKRKEAKLGEEESGLKNPDRNNLDLPRGWDRRLGTKMEEWAQVAFRFAEARMSACAFMQWLSFTWNNCCYWHKVVTRSGGYNHVFTGFSGDEPLRSKRGDNDLFGCVKRTKFTRAQRDQFEEALWWNWHTQQT